jgi:exosome complex component CSL4
MEFQLFCRALQFLKMTSNTPLPPIALPGQPLGPLSSYKPGPGTHLPPSALPSSSPSSIIHASILGPTFTTPAKKGLPILSISRQETVTQQTQTTLLPKEGSIVLGRVTRINIREARVQILVINDTPTMEEFTGVIR